MKHTARHVVSYRDAARISYPRTEAAIITEQDGKDPDCALRSHSLLLIRPRRFDREGVYIWRDAEGIWTIQYVFDKPLLLTGEVSAEVAIEIHGNEAEGMSLLGKTKAVIDGSRPFEAATASFRFAIVGDYVDFDLLVDGKKDPGLVHLGTRGANPQTIPFRLENRPLIWPEGMAAETNRLPVLPVLPKDRGSDRSASAACPTPGTVRCGAGDGGGSKTKE